MVKFDCHDQKLVKCFDVLCNGVIHWGWQHRASSWRSRSGCLRTYRDAWNHINPLAIWNHMRPPARWPCLNWNYLTAPYLCCQSTSIDFFMFFQVSYLPTGQDFLIHTSIEVLRTVSAADSTTDCCSVPVLVMDWSKIRETFLVRSLVCYVLSCYVM